MVRAHLLISGIVQGVGYRWSCQRAAKRIGVTGWVKNLPDGRVETVAQGTKEEIEEFIAWCYRGPEEARVTDIAVSEEEPAGDFHDFEIR